ncbi:MAG: PxKF domain-containing protein [Acidobacteria bacterium]|nr:PxKF domain-containing protein [Acidobacteriota bacterium]
MNSKHNSHVVRSTLRKVCTLAALVSMTGMTAHAARWAVFVQGGWGSGSSSFDQCYGPLCPYIAAAENIDVNGPPYVSAEASGATAYADLRSGKLGVAAVYPVPGSTYLTAQSYAIFIDTLSFAWADDQEKQITFTIKLTGKYSAGSAVDMTVGITGVDLHGASATWGRSDPSLLGGAMLTSIADPDYYGEAIGDWTRIGFDTFSKTVTVPKSSPQLELQLQIGGGGAFQLLDTASVSLSLPPGVTFTSDSGMFLSTVSAYTAAVQQPINSNGLSVFKADRGVVPVKFTLAINGVQTCQLPSATILITRVSGGTSGTVSENEYIQASDVGSNFRVDTANCQYIYNIGARTLGSGRYSVQILIGGQAVGTATFALN